jgi:hypothetical protein
VRRLGERRFFLRANRLLSIGEKRQMLGDMGAMLRNDGFGGARPIFPSHIHALGGGWYCYSALPWLFTYRTPEWTEQEVKAHMARIHKLLW